MSFKLTLYNWVCFFLLKQKTAYEIMPSLVGSEMCIRDSLNITRVDIEAACNNDVLLAVDDIEITIFVYSGNIAGMQPAVAQSFGRLCGIIPVPLHHLRTSDAQFSSFAHREFPVTCLQIHNDTISVWNW